MKILYDKFPREVYLDTPGVVGKRRLIYNMDEFLKFVNKYRFFYNAFSSVYSYLITQSDGTVDYSSVYLDKIYLDIDPKDYDYDYNQMLFDVRKIDKVIQKYKRIFILSGRGFHIYFFINPKVKYQYKKDYVANIQLKIMEITGAKIDASCIGRFDKLARINGTRNQRRNDLTNKMLYCISLSKYELTLSYEEICKIAVKQRKKIYIHGKDVMEYKEEYDFELINFDNLNITFENEELLKLCSGSKYDIMKEFGVEIDKIPPCIRYLINTEEHGYQERTLLILYLKHCSLTLDETREVLKKILDSSRYYHVTGEKIGPVIRKYMGRIEHQDKNLYKKDYYISCKQIRHVGICFFDVCKSKDVLHNLI